MPLPPPAKKEINPPIKIEKCEKSVSGQEKLLSEPEEDNHMICQSETPALK